MDYLYGRVQIVAEELQNKTNPPLQRAFGVHLEKVATALKDIEWVWSYDCAPGSEDEAIREVLGNSAQIGALEQIRNDFKELIQEIEKHFD